MLRLAGLVIVLIYAVTGAQLLVMGDEPTVRLLGLFFVMTGTAWLVVDLLRRRGLI